jgi:hypothetical protein
MFKAIIDNMEGARKTGSLEQGSISTASLNVPNKLKYG